LNRAAWTDRESQTRETADWGGGQGVCKSCVPDSALREEDDDDDDEFWSRIFLSSSSKKQCSFVFQKLSFCPCIICLFAVFPYHLFVVTLLAMSRWNMRAVAMERQRRDDEFDASDDGNDFWWSSVCLL
jgi:hypothetical protein